MQMVRGNGGNQFRQYAGNSAGYNDVIRNQNQIGNGNHVAARAEGNAAGQNGNQIRCYNCRGVEEYDLIAAAADLDEIVEVNANCILMANLQQASTLGTQTDSAPIYDTDGSVEVKSTIVTLQRVVKQRMTIETHNWSSSTHQELHKIVRDENFPIVNQVDARLQNFKIQFLKEAAKFVGDFKSLANEADASLAKHKALELEIERLLKAVATDASLAKHKALELETERLLKAVVSQDIMIIVQNESVVDTLDLQTKLERTKERFETVSLKKKLNMLNSGMIGIKSVSDQKINTQDMSENTKFAKQPIVENLPKVGKTNALSNPVTSNSVSTPQESKSVNNDKVISPGMFRINPSKTSREEKHVSNIVRQLDLPCDIHSEYDSFNSQDFSRDDDLPSHDNEDKVFNPRILSYEKLIKIITRVAQENKLVVSYAFLLFEDFDPSFYELFVFKEVPTSMRLLSFSSENEEKVFKQGIYTSKKVKEYQEKDKIGSKPDKNGKRGEAEKSQKQ
nr:hypothetical protein [Tanacetum cinerariifolium]